MNEGQSTNGREASYDGFSNYETWAYFELLRSVEETLGYWLAQAERVRDEVRHGQDAPEEAVAEVRCQTLLARRLRQAHEAMRGETGGEWWQELERVRWEEIARSFLGESLPPRRPRFPLGRQVITRAAHDALSLLDVCVGTILHSRGVWGDVDEEDAEENERALRDGDRLFSAYQAKSGVRFYVITERDRSVTTVLLPGDY